MTQQDYEIIQAKVKKLRLSKEDSEDLIQDVCMKLLARKEIVPNLELFVGKILRNWTIDQHRKKQARPPTYLWPDFEGIGSRYNAEEILDLRRRLKDGQD